MEYFTITDNKSGMPYPVTPDVGIKLMYSSGSSFSQ
jgi:hypothetical protein